VVAVVADDDIVVGSNRQVARRPELPVAAAAPAKPAHEPVLGVEHVHAVVGRVRHHHVTRLHGDRDAVGTRRKFAPRRRHFDVTSADHAASQRLHDSHATRRHTAPAAAITTSGCDVIVHRHREVAFCRDGYTAQSVSQQHWATCKGTYVLLISPHLISPHLNSDLISSELSTL